MLIAEATAACLAVVASLCVADSAKADINSGPGWVGAVIEMKDVKITSTIASDAIVTPYKNQMTKHCLREGCILYKAYCGKVDSKLGCSIWYLREDALELRRVELTGQKKSVLFVIGRLKLVVFSDAMIPLSAFRYDAQDDSPPTCYARRGCAVE
jgi:hypothetical protein